MDKGGKTILREKVGGGGEGSACDSVSSRRSGGMLPQNLLNFRPSEIASGAFSDLFVAIKWHD